MDEVDCPQCGLAFDIKELIRANGFYGCEECFNEFSQRRGRGKQIPRRPRGRDGQPDMVGSDRW